MESKKSICDDCRHMHCGHAHVGDTAYGNCVDDYECDIEDWTEEDNILLDQNKCRHYERMEEEGVRKEVTEKRRYFLKVGFDVYADCEENAENILYTLLDHLMLDPVAKGDVEVRNYWPDPYVRDCNRVGRITAKEEEYGWEGKD